MANRLFSWGMVCSVGALLWAPLGCINPLDPCTSLAERICACEATQSAQESCRSTRIEALRNQVEITDAEREQCWAALDTCDCGDIEENRFEECGFVRE